MRTDTMLLNTYKNTMPNTNTLAKLGLQEEFKNSFEKEFKMAKQNIQSSLKHKNINNIPELKANPKLENALNKQEIDEKRLKEQTDAFESFMIKSVLDVSLKMENPLYGKDAGDDIYGSMYNDTMSKALSGDLGFSKLLFNFLKERL